MANFLSFLFGSKYPSTAKYEADLQQLYSDRKRYLEFEKSPIYTKFLQLDEIINSGDFEKKVNKLKHEKFEQTDAYQKQKKHHALKKSKDIKTFLDFVQSGREKRLDAILISPTYIEMKELESVVHSSDFQKKMKQKGFKKTDEYQELQSLKKLHKQSDIKFAIKTLNSSDYRTYETVKKSPRLQEFMELDEYINSPEFIDAKEFYHDKDRFKKSEEYKLLHEYNEIKAGPDYKWFFKTKNNYPFTEIDKWELTFEDDFDHQKLDANNWMTGYYWGKALLNDNYVLKHEKQFFTDKNVELRDSKLKITTLKESCHGKIWDPELGFLPANFEYTSGLVSTGHSFRQLYGKYEIKMRLKPGQNLNHAIWLLGERMVPQITALKTVGKNDKTFEAGSITGSVQSPASKSQKFTGTSLSNDFHILTLEWLPNKLAWYVNGVKIGEQTSGIPNEPMYLIFSSHVTEAAADHELPSTMEVDWVRCYKAI